MGDDHVGVRRNLMHGNVDDLHIQVRLFTNFLS